jgi:hypothetical protein
MGDQLVEAGDLFFPTKDSLPAGDGPATRSAGGDGLARQFVESRCAVHDKRT